MKNKKTDINSVIADMCKQYGSGAIMKMGNKSIVNHTGISTGSLSLDMAIAGKGVPRKRITEIYGPESSGKTTLALHIIANAQKGGTAVFIDAEHALDTDWASKLGVKVSSLIVAQPDTGEQALDMVDAMLRSNCADVIVVDSVAALTPKAEIEGEMGDSHMGLHARLMSQAMRKLVSSISKSNTALIFINQIRMKIGVMFGNPETTTGGRALRFYSSVRIDLRRIATIKDNMRPIGSRIRAKVVKNKIAPPFGQAEYDLMFVDGISLSGDVLDVAVQKDIVQRSGAWYNYGALRLGQGREKAKTYLKENLGVYREIKEKLKDIMVKDK